MSAPDRIYINPSEGALGSVVWMLAPFGSYSTEYLRADGPTITAYREALRTMGLDPDSIAREAEKGAQSPAGYIAYPPEVTVPEGGAGTVLILLEGVS